MTRLAAAALLVVATVLLGGPLTVAVLLTAVTAPAVAAGCVSPPEIGGDGSGAVKPGAGTGWRPPFEQAYSVSRRGYGRHFHPVHHEWRTHSGQDLVSLPAPGPVVAVAAGVVTRAGTAGGYGNVVDIDHGAGISTRYAHLARIEVAITPGAPVAAGQRLGLEGSTGVSTGNHLHLEVRMDGTAVDPVPFMAERGAPLDGTAVPAAPRPANQLPPDQTAPDTATTSGPEEDRSLALPAPGEPRRASLVNAPTPIPADVEALYRAAARRFDIPWTVLAGIGMAETNHGRLTATSSAGAQGLMQFMPATWRSMGVDGDGDGRADIHNPADSVHSAAHYLTRSGFTDGSDGVRDALWAYNHADWYVNDVLHYARAYGSGAVSAESTRC